MNNTKRQHFVPQFYLRHFSANENQIFVFDKIENKAFPSSIASVASAKFFYDWDELNSIAGQQYIETKFSKLEAVVGVTLKELIDSLKMPSFSGITTQAKCNIAEYLWYQMIRNQEGRTIAKQVNEILLTHLSEENFPNLVTEKYDEKVEHLKMLLSVDVSKQVDHLTSGIWIFVNNQTAANFYTSDNPVVHHVHEDVHRLARETFFPLTPKLGIMILPREYFQEFETFENQILDLDDEAYIQFYNVLQTSQSTRQIFSISDNLTHAEMLVAKNPQLSEINRRRVI